jgi:hypothetical protein
MVLEYKVVAVLVWPQTRGVGILHSFSFNIPFLQNMSLKN